MNDIVSFSSRDEFNRKPFADKLIQLLKDNHEIFPLAINGNWGTGKTEFCKKTIHLINQEHSDELIAGYFDAFAEDYYDDPLTSLLSKLYTTFPNDEDRSKSISTISKILIATIGQKALEYACPPLGEISKDIQKTLYQFKEQTVLENFKNKAKIDLYLQDLKELITKISNGKIFVLFIDELDRCRPDYALHTLEVIKHIFDIPRLKIVFTINTEQLVEIIKQRYCNNKQIAKKYLDKFFQFQIELPTRTQESYEHQLINSVKFLDLEFNRLNIFELPLFNDGYTEKGCDLASQLLRELTEFYNLSLRDIQKLAKYIHVYSTFINCDKNHFCGIKLILTYAIFQFAFNGKVYENYKLFNDSFKEINDLISYTPSNYSSHIPVRYILYLLLFSENDELLNTHFGGWGRLNNLESRRKILNNTLSYLDNLIIHHRI